MDGAHGGLREAADADASLLRGGLGSLTAGAGNSTACRPGASAVGAIAVDGGLDGELVAAWNDNDEGLYEFESWEALSNESDADDGARDSDAEDGCGESCADEIDGDEAEEGWIAGGNEGGHDDSGEGDCEDDDGDDASYFSCTIPSPLCCPGRELRWHELYLPPDTSPSFEPLKCERRCGGGSSECEDESSDEEDEAASHSHQTYMIGSGCGRHPAACVSSDSECSDDDGSSEQKTPSRPAVSFSDSVTVYPVFDTDSYPPSVVEATHTGLRELRVNKLRNRREFAYDDNDWRNATEDDEMEPDGDGDLVHPVHCKVKTRPAEPQHQQQTQPCAKRSVVRTYSSSLGGYCVGGAAGQKRMRLFYP